MIIDCDWQRKKTNSWQRNAEGTRVRMAATAVVRKTARERSAKNCAGACPASAAAIAAYVRTVTSISFIISFIFVFVVWYWGRMGHLSHIAGLTQSTHSCFSGFRHVIRARLSAYKLTLSPVFRRTLNHRILFLYLFVHLFVHCHSRVVLCLPETTK